MGAAPTLPEGGEGPWSEGSTVFSSDDILKQKDDIMLHYVVGARFLVTRRSSPATSCGLDDGSAPSTRRPFRFPLHARPMARLQRLEHVEAVRGGGTAK